VLELKNNPNNSFEERAKWIPVRLTLEERKMLRLLDSALLVSEYTDKIDIVGVRTSSKPARIVTQIKDLCAILCGLLVASNFESGQELIRDRDYKANEDLFQKIFEIGRRHKIMNPEKMRSTYGKLVYLLMDASSPDIQDLLEFNCVSPIKTVYSCLEENKALSLLQDPLLPVATQEIVSDNKSRREIQVEIKRKERAIELLSSRYSSKCFSSETLKQCIYSISDNNSYLAGNVHPITKMIKFLQEYFSPNSTEPKFSLSISHGANGARLTHNHERHYTYVLQSLTLWQEVVRDMFRLWGLTEQDLLDESNPYRLRDTGQGLNRVQSCPRVGKAISGILNKTINSLGSWVGSSVIHLGDHNVPNALMFIDKYTQISRILGPVVLCIEKIDNDLAKNPSILRYINETFISTLHLKKTILVDFFKHAFDGSGADNFFDAGR
jgi:hypothetical protein